MTDYSTFTTEYIKGRADIFSYAIEVLDNCMENKKEISSKEFMYNIENFANTPLKEGYNKEYTTGSNSAIELIYDYFNGRDYGLVEYTIKDTYNMIEEEFEYTLQELKKRSVI